MDLRVNMRSSLERRHFYSSVDQCCRLTGLKFNENISNYADFPQSLKKSIFDRIKTEVGESKDPGCVTSLRRTIQRMSADNPMNQDERNMGVEGMGRR